MYALWTQISKRSKNNRNRKSTKYRTYCMTYRKRIASKEQICRLREHKIYRMLDRPRCKYWHDKAKSCRSINLGWTFIITVWFSKLIVFCTTTMHPEVSVMSSLLVGVCASRRVATQRVVCIMHSFLIYWPLTNIYYSHWNVNIIYKIHWIGKIAKYHICAIFVN